MPIDEQWQVVVVDNDDTAKPKPELAASFNGILASSAPSCGMC
jgi:hypothetical protein